MRDPLIDTKPCKSTQETEMQDRIFLPKSDILWVVLHWLAEPMDCTKKARFLLIQ